VASLEMAAGLPGEAALRLLASAVDLVVHLHRPARGPRRVRDLGVLERQGSEVAVVPAVTFDEDLRPIPGQGLDLLEELLAP
jgi:pilus assembly protein CpaF